MRDKIYLEEVVTGHLLEMQTKFLKRLNSFNFLLITISAFFVFQNLVK